MYLDDIEQIFLMAHPGQFSRVCSAVSPGK